MDLSHHPERNDSLPIARTEKGVAYEAALSELRRKALTKEGRDQLKRANEELLALRDITPGAVSSNPVIATMSVMYANDEFIGERLAPLVMTGGQLTARYFKYDKRDRTAVVDDTVTTDGVNKQISQNRSLDSVALQERAIADFVSQATLNAQAAPLDELLDATTAIAEVQALGREQRIATLLSTTSSYGSQYTTLSGADQWNSSTGGDPASVIDTARAAIWSGAGPGKTVAFCSLDVHNVLKRHDKILSTIKYQGGKPGFATREMLRDYFEVDEYLVGAARRDTANIGQTASYSRIWGKIFGIVRVAKMPSIRNAGFASTFQDAEPFADQIWDARPGSRGGYLCKRGFSDVSKVVAPDAGYLVNAAIA